MRYYLDVVAMSVRLPRPGSRSRQSHGLRLVLAGAAAGSVMLIATSCGGGHAGAPATEPPRPPSTAHARALLFVGGGGPEGAVLWALSRRPGLVWQVRLPGGGIVSLRLCDHLRVLVGLRPRTNPTTAFAE